MSTGGTVLVALVIAVGLIGIVVPLLPGVLLVYAAILVWAVVEHNVTAWVTLGVVTVLIGATTLIKYMWPMKRMRAADVGTGTLLAGAVLGIIGFFVVPIVGLVIGFVLGVYIAELANHHPDIDVRYSNITLSLVTHDQGGITPRDVALARQVEAIRRKAGVPA